MLGQKDVNDLKAQSLKEHLQCYTSSSPPTLREMFSQDISAAVEDITSKFIHVYHGYSCSRGGQPKPIANNSNKVLSVRMVYNHSVCVVPCKHGHIVLYTIQQVLYHVWPLL